MKTYIAILFLISLSGCMMGDAQIAASRSPVQAAGGALAPPEAEGQIEITVETLARKLTVVRFRKDEPCTLLNLLLKMGGLPPYTGPDAVIRRRSPEGTEVDIKVNVRDLLETGEPEKDVPLKRGTGDRPCAGEVSH
jgi:hypothetical protein